MIGVIDYGAGNIMSVRNALSFLGFDSIVSADVQQLGRCDRLILPGVGAFPAAMERLNASGLTAFVRQETKRKPLLGICLGMQILLARGEEVRPCAGLGLIAGEVRRIETPLKLPHIGWNGLELRHPSPLLHGVQDGAFVYFVHSYCAVPEREEDLLAVTDYGAKVAAIVARGNVYGCQFHPEKSGEAGLTILKNFGELEADEDTACD